MNLDELTLNKELRIDELEKIKEEIDRVISDFYMENSDIAYGLAIAECILDKHISKLIGEKSLVIPKEVFEQMKIQVETKDGEVVEYDIDTSVLSDCLNGIS